MVAKKVGLNILRGVEAFHQGDYETVVKQLHPVRFEMQDLLGKLKLYHSKKIA